MPQDKVEIPKGATVGVPIPQGATVGMGQQDFAPPTSESLEYAKQFGQGALNILGGVGASAIKPLSSLYEASETPLENLGFSPETIKKGEDYLRQLSTPPEGAAGSFGRYAGEALQYLAPAGVEEKLATRIGEALPSAPAVVRGAAKLLPAAVSGGAVSAGQGTGFVPGAALGLVGGATTEGIKGLAGGIAARAAGVTEKQLKYGARPEREILDLPGLRPKTIRASAGQKALQLTRELESEASMGKDVDLRPVKESVDDALRKADRQEDITTFSHLQPLVDQVSRLPDRAPARQALEYKRGLKTLSNFQNLSPVTTSTRQAARDAYHEADKALDLAVPKANNLDDRIHSLLTISGARGTGRMGLGRYFLPIVAARAMGPGPLGEIAAGGLTFAAEEPTGRIIAAKALARAPRLERIARPAALPIVQQLMNEK